MGRRSDIDGGWAYAVGFGVFVSFFLIAGFARGFGILYAAFLSTFDQSDSVTSLLVGVRSACSIVSGPLGTALSQRFSERKVVIAGALITSLGFSLSFFATSLEFLIVTIGVLQGIGNAILIGPSNVSMSNYFVKKRSRAMTVASCGGCIGMMVVPILLQKLVEHYSVRGALLIYGALSLHLILTGAFLRPLKADDMSVSRDTEDSEEKGRQLQQHCEKNECLKDFSQNMSSSGNESGGAMIIEKRSKIYKDELRNETFELVVVRGKNGFETETKTSTTEAKISPIIPNNSLKPSRLIGTLAETFGLSLFKDPLFVLILTSGTLTAIPYATLTMFLVPLLESRGISRDMAAILLSIMGGCDIVGRLVCGTLADRRPLQPKHVIIVGCVVGGVVCSLLAIASGFYEFLGLVIAYGLVCSAPTVLILPAMANFVGLKALPKAVGAIMFGTGISTSIAPSLLGLIKDKTGSYSSIFPVIGCINVCGGLVLLLEILVRRTRKQPQSAV